MDKVNSLENSQFLSAPWIYGSIDIINAVIFNNSRIGIVPVNDRIMDKTVVLLTVQRGYEE
jgi:hypothetical protein